MPIKAMPCVSIRCDSCGRGHDEIYSTPAAEMEHLKLKEGCTEWVQTLESTEAVRECLEK